uniref:Uncharacterized protein MANES_03G150200 n=1 Tax=Rhizophora mucronata TaxID=61149 RepID=A0A2P2JQB0_RHIMU
MGGLRRLGTTSLLWLHTGLRYAKLNAVASRTPMLMIYLHLF